MAENTASTDNGDPRMNVAFQGQFGAYSHLACQEGLPAYTPLPCRTFEDAFAAVSEGRAGRAMIPIENSLAGRVADIHHLIPTSDQYIVGEHFQAVNHQLMAPHGAKLEDIREVHSHIHALPQCRKLIRELGIEPVVHADTAGAAAEISELGDISQAAIASQLAGEVYGLKSLKANIEDAEHNTTRFLVFARKAVKPKRNGEPLITSFVFRVRNVPAALYKAMGGFATNGVNMTKLESYMVGGDFQASQFFADIEGDPRDRNVQLALEELEFFSREVRVFGTYPAHPFRRKG